MPTDKQPIKPNVLGYAFVTLILVFAVMCLAKVGLIWFT